MKKSKKLKVGDFLWWKRVGNSTNQNIDCVCKITIVSKIGIRVQRLDNFIETELIKFESDEFKDEMSPCKESDAKRRSEGILFLLEERNRIAETDAKLAKENLSSFKKGIQATFSDI